MTVDQLRTHLAELPGHLEVAVRYEAGEDMTVLLGTLERANVEPGATGMPHLVLDAYEDVSERTARQGSDDDLAQDRTAHQE